MTLRLDHANLAVRDLDGMIRFLQTAFPEFRVRGGGTSPTGARWAHVGTDEVYLALSEASRDPSEPRVPYSGVPGLNHLGFEVDDVEAVHARLLAAGYRDSTVFNAHPARKRAYVLDHEGNDWELVQYLTDDPALRHDYDLADA